MHGVAGAAQRRVLLQQLPDAVSEFLSSGRRAAAARCAAAGLRGFDAAYSFGAYEGVLRELIHLYKYGKIRTLARPLSGLLAQALPRDEVFDAIGAGAALLASPVAARIQSVGIAGPRAGPRAPVFR